MSARVAGLALMLLSLAAGAADCERLATADAFDQLAGRMQTEPRRAEAMLGACGLDYETLRRQHCDRAYSHEDLQFIYAHCPDEAWSLARAQCERNTGSESARYAEFCRAFKSGRAPDLRR